MEFLLLWLLFAFASGAVAGGKGRSGVGWFLLGLLFGIFALVVVACLPSRRAQEILITNPDGTVSRGRVGHPPSESGRFLVFLIGVFVTIYVVTSILQALGVAQ